VALFVWFAVGWILTAQMGDTLMPWVAIATAAAISLLAARVRMPSVNPTRSPALLRTVVATTLVGTVLAISYFGGERLAGLFTTFPILAFSLIAPVYFRRETTRAMAMTQGMMMAGVSLAVFTGSVWFGLSHGWPPAAVFAGALGFAIFVHVTVRALGQGLTASGGSSVRAQST